MSVIVRKKNGRYRVTEYDTGRVVKNKNGKPVDGGGHEDQTKAERQVAYINSGSKDDVST